MLEDIEEATSAHVVIQAHRVEPQRAQRSTLNNTKVSKDFMKSSRTPRIGYMVLYTMTGENIVEQGTHHSSALCLERKVGNVTRTITLM